MWHSRAHEGFEVRRGGVSRSWTHFCQSRRVWAPHSTVQASQRRVYVDINDIYGLIERMGAERRGTSACDVCGSTAVNHSEFERRTRPFTIFFPQLLHDTSQTETTYIAFEAH